MNKLYRVIWNRAAQSFVVASELASTRAGTGAARLAGPVLMALLLPVNAMAQSQVADGNSLVVSPGDYATTNAGEGALVARNGGDLQADDVNVITTGSGATGVLANGINSTGTQIDISDSHVSTQGDNAVGMAAVDSDSRIDANHVNVTTTGENSAGVLAAGQNGNGTSAPVVSLSDSSLNTSGDQAAGVIAEGGGRVGLFDSSVTTSGDGSTGVVVSDGGSVTAENTTISTSGNGANGVDVINDSIHTSFDLSDGGIATQGDESIGLMVNNGHVASLDNVSVSTAGQGSTGILSSGSNSSGVRSTVFVSASHVSTSGEGSSGLAAGDGGVIQASDTSVTTTGNNADGVSVSGANSQVTLVNSSVNAQGSGSSASQLNGGTLDASGSSLTSTQGSAIETSGASTINLSNSTRVSGGKGVFVQVDDENSAVNLTLDQRTRALGNINGVDSNGDGLISATTDMTLTNQSSWRGSTNGAVDQLSLSGGSEWTMTGDSTVGQMSLDHSAVVFARPTEGDYKTLTVTGDFSSDGGVLLMNSELNGDDSGTDLLHVEGDTSGQAYVHVNNVGGMGTGTTDGIELIQVDGQSNAEFSLAGRAVGGTNEYFLYQGSYTDPNDGDWYLRSEIPADPSDPTAPTDPSTPLTPSVPVYRPEVGSYLSNQAAAVNMFQLSMHDRLGSPELDPQRISDDRLGSLWVRVNRNDADYTGGKHQLDVDSDTSVLQMGADLVHWGQDSRGLLGVMVGTGSNENTTRSDLTGYSAKGEVDGTAVGVYGTWFADPKGATGLYVDTWLQYGRYNNSVQGEGLDRENYDSRTLAGSIEAGYSWKVFSSPTSSLYLQPQLQVTATHYDSDDHQETNGTEIESDQAGGVTTRTGLRVYGQIDLDNGMKAQPFATVNWYHNSQDNAVAFNDSVMQGGDPKNRYEFKTGAQLVLGKHWSTWGQVGVQSGEDDYRDVSAQVGVKYHF